MNKRHLQVTAAAVGLIAVGALAGFALKARADGIPSPNPLYYSGTLTESGQLVSGSRTLGVNLYADGTTMTPLCSIIASNTNVVGGRFRVQLPDTCKGAINANPNAYVEVVDGTVNLGRAKIGAVPYAVEADHAVTATNATNATSATNATNAGHATSADNATLANSLVDNNTAQDGAHHFSESWTGNDLHFWVDSTNVATLPGGLVSLGSTLQGSAPAAGSTPFLWQAGTFVGTADSSGHLPISFPKTFPGGLASVVITNSFPQGSSVAGVLDNETAAGFTVVMGAGQLTRINWIALGW